eukprot:366130-Chlamydomonas_euryale.AAC.3
MLELATTTPTPAQPNRPRGARAAGSMPDPADRVDGEPNARWSEVSGEVRMHGGHATGVRPRTHRHMRVLAHACMDTSHAPTPPSDCVCACAIAPPTLSSTGDPQLAASRCRLAAQQLAACFGRAHSKCRARF